MHSVSTVVNQARPSPLWNLGWVMLFTQHARWVTQGISAASTLR